MLPPHVGHVPAELASLLLVLISQHAHLGHTSKGTWRVGNSADKYFASWTRQKVHKGSFSCVCHVHCWSQHLAQLIQRMLLMEKQCPGILCLSFPLFPHAVKLACVCTIADWKPRVYPCESTVSGVGFKLEHPEAATFWNLRTLCKRLFRSAYLKK